MRCKLVEQCDDLHTQTSYSLARKNQWYRTDTGFVLTHLFGASWHELAKHTTSQRPIKESLNYPSPQRSAHLLLLLAVLD